MFLKKRVRFLDYSGLRLCFVLFLVMIVLPAFGIVVDNRGCWQKCS